MAVARSAPRRPRRRPAHPPASAGAARAGRRPRRAARTCCSLSLCTPAGPTATCTIPVSSPPRADAIASADAAACSGSSRALPRTNTRRAPSSAAASATRRREIDAVAGRPGEVVIGHGRHAAEERLGQAGSRRGASQLGVHPHRGVRGGHARQPLPHRHTAGAGQGAEGGLQEVVVGVDQAGRHDAAGRVERPHPGRPRPQHAHRRSGRSHRGSPPRRSTPGRHR